MPMSYDYYHVFYYVGKYHSFTRAAQKLMSPAARELIRILQEK